jgi:WD40 repeat protein
LSVAWSPDSTRIVSGSWDRTVRIWDAGTGELQQTLPGHAHYV